MSTISPTSILYIVINGGNAFILKKCPKKCFFVQMFFVIDSLGPGHYPRGNIEDFFENGHMTFFPCGLHIYIRLHQTPLFFKTSCSVGRNDPYHKRLISVKFYENWCICKSLPNWKTQGYDFYQGCSYYSPK